LAVCAAAGSVTTNNAFIVQRCRRPPGSKCRSTERREVLTVRRVATPPSAYRVPPGLRRVLSSWIAGGNLTLEQVSAAGVVGINTRFMLFVEGHTGMAVKEEASHRLPSSPMHRPSRKESVEESRRSSVRNVHTPVRHPRHHNGNKWSRSHTAEPGLAVWSSIGITAPVQSQPLPPTKRYGAKQQQHVTPTVECRNYHQ
jgi:hypothetical protein